MTIDFLLFGGILGDDPPQDRTRFLREKGYATRHLGPVQMTTDTACLVCAEVLERALKLSELEYVDHPEIVVGKKEKVQMPFRYLKGGNGIVLAPGMVEHLKKDEFIEE